MSGDHLADLLMPGIRGKMGQLEHLVEYLQNIPVAIKNNLGWKPIDTAPVDGTAFIGVKVFHNKLATIAIVKKNPKLPDKMWQCCASVMISPQGTLDGEDTDRGLGFLTHWMPLPNQPQETD